MRHQALAGIDIAMRTEHPRHRTVRIAFDDMPTVLDPQVTAVGTSAAVFHPVLFGTLRDVSLEVSHYPRVIIRMDDALPGEHRIVQRMTGVAEHLVPARVAIDVAGVGIPVPDTIADEVQQSLQLLTLERD
ncbi:hypothetical protein D3C80_1428560 [compost metagenome]